MARLEQRYDDFVLTATIQIEGMFYEHTSLDISVQEYLKENTPPMLLYVFIKSNGENFTVKDCENMSLFLEQLAKYDFIDEPSTSFFLVKPEAYESVEEEFYKQMENENVWPFYLDKEKIITAGDFEIREGKVTVGIDDINNELQRIKELIW